MNDLAPYRLHDSIGYHLSIASRVQERRLDEWLKTVGLTRTSWCVLLSVGNEALTKPSEIASFIGIDRTTVSRALRWMEQEGLLRRRAGQGDRRTRTVELTPAGASVIEQATVFARQNAQMIAARLEPEDIEQLRKILVKLRPLSEETLSGL